MNVSLLISLFSLLITGPQIPNYYRSYPTARAESSRAQKEMLIFFSSTTCDNCNSAWTAFAKDAIAVNKYISTQVANDNFDGQILYEHFDPGSVPAWVILDADGKVKERWQGGWKDAYGKGTLFVQETPLNETPKKSEVVTTPKSSTPSTTSTSNNSTTTTPSKTTPAATKSAEETIVKATPEPVKKDEATLNPSSSTSSGFVIQAGYFGSETNAQKCITDLKAKGFTQFSIKPLQQNGATFYRVWSSSYATEKEAQGKLEQLSAAGFKGTVKSAS